jgi:hypothetical protein
MAGTRVDMTGYKEVQFTFDQVHMKGGYITQPLPVIAKRIQVSGFPKYFVKMTAKDAWLIKATCGYKKHHETSFQRTTLLEDLRDKLLRACNGECKPDMPNADVDDVERDFMEEIFVGNVDKSPQDKSPQKGGGAKRARYSKNDMKHRVFVTQMPEKCPEEVPDCQQMRQISMLIEDRKTIWLCTEDIGWAVSYLWVQNMLKGVPLVPADSQGPSDDT